MVRVVSVFHVFHVVFLVDFAVVRGLSVLRVGTSGAVSDISAPLVTLLPVKSRDILLSVFKKARPTNLRTNSQTNSTQISTASTDDPTNSPQHSPSMLSTATDSGSTPSGPPPPCLYASTVSIGLSATGTAPANTNSPLTASTHPPAHNSRNTDSCTYPGYHPNPTGTTGLVGTMGPSSL